MLNWFRRRKASSVVKALADNAPAPEPAPAQRRKGVSFSAVAASGAPDEGSRFQLTPITRVARIEDAYTPAAPPQFAKDADMALDFDEIERVTAGAGINFGEGIGFLGYPYLSELAQRPEYRMITETTAAEMTREWIEIKAQGEGDKTQRIKAIEAEFERLKVKDAFRRMIELDGFFGRGQVYLDTGYTDDPNELDLPLPIDKRKIRMGNGKGSLRRLIVVEPIWTYPDSYNTSDPLHADFYQPRRWLVMGRKVHHTRLLTMVSREVADILKPAYVFGGLSMSQMAKPYVDNWLRTRQSVSDLLHSFTVWGIKTDLSAVMGGGDAETLINRAKLFNQTRDNRGLMMINKGESQGDLGEEFFNVSVPLGGLDHLQAQSQEQMCTVARTPMVKLLGTTPSGLNASSDGEIRVYYDHIASLQEKDVKPLLTKVFKIVQLSLFGEIDDDLDFVFRPLWQSDEQADATIKKAEADVDVEYINAGVLSPEEVRGKLASNKESPYAMIDPNNAPTTPETDEAMQALLTGGGAGEGAIGGDPSPGGAKPPGPGPSDPTPPAPNPHPAGQPSGGAKPQTPPAR